MASKHQAAHAAEAPVSLRLALVSAQSLHVVAWCAAHQFTKSGDECRKAIVSALNGNVRYPHALLQKRKRCKQSGALSPLPKRHARIRHKAPAQRLIADTQVGAEMSHWKTTVGVRSKIAAN